MSNNLVEQMSAQVEQHLQQVESRLQQIEAERRQLLKLKASFTAVKATKGGTGTEPKQERIADSVFKLLRGAKQPLRLKDIYEKLVEQGRTFTGSNPRMSIYVALTRHPNLFTKVGQGWSVTKGATKSVNL